MVLKKDGTATTLNSSLRKFSKLKQDLYQARIQENTARSYVWPTLPRIGKQFLIHWRLSSNLNVCGSPENDRFDLNRVPAYLFHVLIENRVELVSGFAAQGRVADELVHQPDGRRVVGACNVGGFFNDVVHVGQTAGDFLLTSGRRLEVFDDVANHTREDVIDGCSDVGVDSDVVSCDVVFCDALNADNGSNAVNIVVFVALSQPERPDLCTNDSASDDTVEDVGDEKSWRRWLRKSGQDGLDVGKFFGLKMSTYGAIETGS